MAPANLPAIHKTIGTTHFFREAKTLKWQKRSNFAYITFRTRKLMSIISKLFSNKEKAEKKVGGMEDFMYLIRVYYQSVMATRMGITSLQALPDLRLFKQTLHIPTINNRLGQGEKNKCQKMMTEIYHLPDSFFKEIDNSIKTNCSKSILIINIFLFNLFNC